MQATAPYPTRTDRQEAKLGGALALLSSVAIMYANFMHVAILGMHERLGLSLQVAGDISSLNLLGVAIGALVAACAPRQLVGTTAAVASLCAMVTLDIACCAFTQLQLPMLAGLRALHGLAGGVLLAFCGAALAGTRAPERIMGAALAFQLGSASLAALYLPAVVLARGIWPVFGIMATLEVLALAILLTAWHELALRQPQPRAEPRDLAGGAPAARANVLGAAALASLLLFQGSRFMVVGYGFAVGHLFGYDNNATGAVIGLASWMAGGGALMAALMPARWGRVKPLLAAGAGTLAASTMLICWGSRPHVFMLATCAIALCTFIALPFQYGVCFALDRSGRLGMWTGFASKAGLAAGPSVGALYMLCHGLGALLVLSAGLVFAATLTAVGVALMAGRGAEAPW